MLSVAFLARLAVMAYAVHHFPASWFYTRGLEMGYLADSLVHGAGLSSPFGPPTGPTAMIAPGYPVFVAAVFRLLGSYSRAAELALLGFNLAFNILTVGLILRIGRRLAGERAAVWVALFWACSLPLLWIPTIFWETSVSMFLLLGFVEIAMWLRNGSRASQWGASGAYCGVAGLVNPALLPSLIAMTIWALWTRRVGGKFRSASLALLAFVLVFSPWPIRNARVFHAWIPTRTTVGFELWMGNRPDATGFLEQSLFPTYSPTELASYRASGEVHYMDHKFELGCEYIRTHPSTFLRLTVFRVMRFWTGSGNREGSLFFILHAMVTALLGIAGLVYLVRSADRRIAPALLLPLVLFPLPYYVTHAEFRYRLVLDPLLAALSAKALQQAFVARLPLSRFTGFGNIFMRKPRRRHGLRIPRP